MPTTTIGTRCNRTSAPGTPCRVYGSVLCCRPLAPPLLQIRILSKGKKQKRWPGRSPHDVDTEREPRAPTRAKRLFCDRTPRTRHRRVHYSTHARHRPAECGEVSGQVLLSPGPVVEVPPAPRQVPARSSTSFPGSDASTAP